VSFKVVQGQKGLQADAGRSSLSNSGRSSTPAEAILRCVFVHPGESRRRKLAAIVEVALRIGGEGDDPSLSNPACTTSAVSTCRACCRTAWPGTSGRSCFSIISAGPFRRGAGHGRAPHPHIGLATVTYLFDGAVEHRDNLGSVQTIRAGDVNWMTAGRGIAHVRTHAGPGARPPATTYMASDGGGVARDAEENCA